MKYIGKFFHPRKKVTFYGLYDFDENVVFPIESIFYPNITGEPFNFNQLHPVLCVKPSKIVGIGKNYKGHIQEFQSEVPEEPIIFLKSTDSIIGPNDKIILPMNVGQIDYEGEIALVVGKKAEKVSEAKALNYILGYACANDITARELQKKDGQWARAKSFKSFCPFGPWILPVSEYPKYNNLTLKTYVNDKPVQQVKSSSMIFNIPYLVSFISQAMTLYPGDIILTGTPYGVGPLKRNYKVQIEIEEIGTLTNRVVGETSTKSSNSSDEELSTVS